MSDDISKRRVLRAAQEMYRAAWTRWLAANDFATKKSMQKAMDAVQPWCTESGRPDDEWKRFEATLPGYTQYWNETVSRLQDEVLARLRNQKKSDKPDDDLPPTG